MKSLAMYWRLSEKDKQLAEMLKNGADIRTIRKRLGLTYRQIKQKEAKLRRLGIL